MNYHTKTIEEIQKKFKTNTQTGLSKAQVLEKQATFGKNESKKQEEETLFQTIIKQFKDVFTIILLIAAGLSYIFADHTDALIILAAIIINVLISVIQEKRASKTIQELKEIQVDKARVVRNNTILHINASDVVPGDIIIIQAGDKIPADARLFSSNELTTKEASLTGESEDIEKDSKKIPDEESQIGDRKNMIYASTIVTNGKGKGIVIATGKNTEVGKITELVESTEEDLTPLQKRMNSLSLKLSVGFIIASIIVFLSGILLGRNITEMFTFAIALAVSSIPEGLVLTVTIILVVGMRQILKRSAIVRELVAAETLGSTTIICTDKTGTLTTGEMKAEKIATHDKTFEIKDLQKNQITNSKNLFWASKTAALCHELSIENLEDCTNAHGDTTEKALFNFTKSKNISFCELRKTHSKYAEIPFDSKRKYMATAHSIGNKEHILLAKGALEKIVKKASHTFLNNEKIKISPELIKNFKKKEHELSSEGYRVIALAHKIQKQPINIKEDLNNLTITAIIGIRDPLRANIKETIQKTLRAGIDVRMITGDHPETAYAIAKDAGLQIKDKTQILTGSEIAKLKEDKNELTKRIIYSKVFARVAPQDKLEIVKALQKNNEVVAMTGDGVNDGPALKKADIGISMGSGTKVAQQTSSIILLDDNFKTIVAAIEEGRRIFNNIRKVVLYLLSDSFSEIILILGSVLLGFPIPLIAAQILWINLVGDGFLGAALAFDPAENDTMRQNPIKKDTSIITKKMIELIAVISLITGIGMLALFYWLYIIKGTPLAEVRTIIFCFLAFDSLLYVFSIRDPHTSFFHEKFFSNWYLIAAVILGFALQLAAVYFPPLQKLFQTTPLNSFDWLIITIASITTITAIEIAKKILYRKSQKT